MMGAPAMGSGTQPQQVSVSVVLPVRDGREVIGTQIASLAQQTTDLAWELVVADNGSTDGTANEVRRWESSLPSLVVVDASRRSGINVARNAGVAAARGRLILHCDDDDAVAADWIDRMATALSSADVVGGAVELRSLNGDLRFASDLPAEPRIPTQHHALPWAIGCNLGYSREVFDAIGGFDEGLPERGGGDLDFSWRAQQAGFRFQHVPDAVVARRLRPTLASALKQHYRYGRASVVLDARFTPRVTGPVEPTTRASFAREMVLRSRQVVQGPLPRRQYLQQVAYHLGRQVAKRSRRATEPGQPVPR